MDDVVTEPVRGSIGDLRVFQRPGLETMRRFLRGELPVFPISRLFGSRVTDVGLGKATFAMPVTRWLEDGFGLYWSGIHALVADAPLACAIWTTLPAGRTAATTELGLSFIRPFSRRTTQLVGRAEVVHTSSQVGLSTIQITDQEGRLLTFGSTRCLVSDVPVDPAADYPAPDLGPADPPDPYLRPAPEDGYYTREQILNGRPLDLQQFLTRGEKIFPIMRLTGYRATSIEEGRALAVLPTSPWHSNGGGAVYGGTLAWAAELTMGAAVYSTLGPGDVFGTLDMHVRFTRPARIDSGNLTFSAAVAHRGKRLRVTSCTVEDREGRRVAMATSSALVIEGGAREFTKGRQPEEIVAGVESGGP